MTKPIVMAERLSTRLLHQDRYPGESDKHFVERKNQERILAAARIDVLEITLQGAIDALERGATPAQVLEFLKGATNQGAK